jgi:hypothetical protein
MGKVTPRDQCCLCGKLKQQVQKLIVGLHGAVCSDCIDLCNDILHNKTDHQVITSAQDRGEGYDLFIPSEVALALGNERQLLDLLRMLAGCVSARAMELGDSGQ